jgi:RHS repeat-associated protein
MKLMNRQCVFLALFLTATVNHVFGQTDNGGPVSASDQAIQEQDLAGKRGKQQVDLFTGSFGYSIPIACAPARNGSEPALTLAYSSGDADGWCGMGWQLQIGDIERNTVDGFPIQYSTGSPQTPLTAYDNSKGFLLHLFGKELKLLPTATTNEFDAEVDTDFLHCVLDNTNNRWLVYDKSGNIYYFGQVAASRESNPKTGWSGSSGTFYWALDQVVTATGDNTTVAYTNYNDPVTSQPERTLYPTQITYNGHISNNGYSATYTGTSTITFASGLRPDERFSYRYGFRTEQNRRLTNIVCSVGSQNVWQYSLGYTASSATGRSLLSTLTTYGFDANNNATALPVQTFGYQANPNAVSFGPVIAWTNMVPTVPGGGSGSSDPYVTTLSSSGNSVADLVDMDGDGLPDRVVWDDTTQPNQYQVQRNNGTGGFGARYAFGPASTATSGMSSSQAQTGSTSNLLPDDSTYSILNSANGRIRDLNGDGLPDRVMDYWPAINSILQGYNYVPYTNYEAMLNTGSGFAGVTAWPVLNLIAPGDADGVGFTYECVEGGGTITQPGGYVIQTSVGLLDLNGDSLPDRVQAMPASYISTYGPLTNLYVSINTGTNFTGLRTFAYKSQNWNGSGTQSANSVSQWTGLDTQEAHMIDINGDGLPDHVMFPMNPASPGTDLHPASYFAVEYNDGYAFESTNTSTAVPGAFDVWPGVATQPNNGGNYDNTPVYADSLINLPFAGMYDLNGDGLPDRVVIDVASLNVASSYDTWYVYLNNGTGFNTNPIVLTNIYNQGHYIIGTDFAWWSPQCSDSSGDLLTTMIDINGDGLLDRVMKVYDNGNGVANTTSNYFLVQLNTSPPPDLLTNISNGIGGNLAVSYKPSTAYDNSRVPGSPLLGSELPFIYQTVSTVTENDGINPARTTSYGYAGGYYNGPRREFHGFAVVGVTNPPSPISAPYNRTMVSYFHQGGGQSRTNLGEYLDPANFAKDGIAYRTETYGNDGLLYHVTINQVNQAALPAASGYARYFPFTQLTFDCDYPGGGTPRVTAKQFAYDVSNGNLTNAIEYGEVTNFNATNVGNFTFRDVNSADNRQQNIHYTAINTYILDHPDKVNLTDGSGNILKETDYTYNAGGTPATKLTLISPGYYATNTYGSYTAYGLAGLITDPVGVQTEIAYDSTFNQYPATTRIRANPGSDGSGDFVTEASYDVRSGLVTGTTDPMGVTVTNTYDALQRPIESDKIPVSGAAVWQKKYDYPATLTAITGGVATNYIDSVANDGVGGFTNRTYVDGFERPVQTLTQGENNNYRVLSTVYDERGEAFLTTWPSFATTLNYTKPASQTANWTGFDAPGRVATNRVVTATFTSGTFSSLNNLGGDTGSPLAATTISYLNGTDPWWVIVTDADGDVRRYALDAFGRTNQIQEINGGSTYTTMLRYDLADNLTNVVDATGTNSMSWQYDNAGGLTAMADPHLGLWTYQRDYTERLRRQTDACSNVVVLSYVNPATGQQDPLGRVQTKLVYTTNPTNQAQTLQSGVTNLYDSSGGDGNYTVYPGLLFETLDSQGYEKEGYDSRGRPVKTTRHLNMNGGSYTTSTTYNDGDHVTSTAYPNGGPTITNTYFHGGSLNQVSLSGGSVNYYTISAGNYDVFEHATNFTYGNSLTTIRTYYPVSARLEKIAVGSSGSIFTRSYAYTAGDDVASLSGTGISGMMNVAYDGVHRITSYSGLTGNYGYDSVGNMTANIESGAAQAYGYGVRRPDAVKLVNGSGYLYDLCGNMIVRQTSATNGEQLVYDGENQLVRYADVNTNFTLVKFGYAGDGTRLWKWSNLTTNLQVWVGDIYEEKQGKILYHVYAGGEQVCTFETNSPLWGGSNTNAVGYYYHQDTLNSSSALSSSSGSQQEYSVFYPFGRVQTNSSQAGTFAVSRQFTGQVRDDETGLYYYGGSGDYGRYYDILIDRFVQADDRIPDLSNPQTYNRYTYCVNDPLRYNDPSGHAPSDDDDDPTEHLSLTLGGNQAVQRRSAGIASAQLYNQSKVDFRNVASTAKAAVELNPVISGAEAVSGKDIVSGEKLTASQRLLAAGGAVPGMSLESDSLKVGEAAAGKAVLGKFPDYLKLGEKLNAKTFNIPTDVWNKMSKAEQWAANQKFLDRAIARGDVFVLSNPVTDINSVTGALRRELDYLFSKGYKLSDDGTRLVKPAQ